ncbi:hypothetical protein GUITHDRAFT_100810 [Guillardia theta CCMP2712]|uniref:Hcy-binding domain-containing protein n=1 Tax=Guillardia theta (strain CCMP2712) TaxID=905079 RepID=L1K087_GUITC|nr:hypothetical protein GUITHDRAFT_100810 [Guillardia theta CCMP2712]EKX53845.1 hypothetical protein GUITHDRAFT_100810 [Guillardia theta CCMP2712]|eukprot:XP_005840825.1 hypothetical protein GUITHDRAFT_100810 [Guillardia theta CCMP2712]
MRQTNGGKAMRRILEEGKPGILHTKAFEECNVTAANKVKAVHLSFIEAGANIIETNTFGANKFALARYGLTNVVEINQAGVKIAQEAVAESGKGTIIAGAVGPTGEGTGFIDDDKAKEIALAYEVQIKAMVDAGVDAIMLETFTYLAEIRIALSKVKELFAGPVIASMAFSDEPAATNHYGPGKVAQLLHKWGADVVGVNCGGDGEGSGREDQQPSMTLRRRWSRQWEAAFLCVSGVLACPNAGHPKRVGHRNIYMATEEYFLVYAKRLFKSGVRMFGGGSDVVPSPPASTQTTKNEKNSKPAAVAKEPIPVSERTKLSSKIARIWKDRLASGKEKKDPIGPEDFVVSVEVNPAPGLSTEKVRVLTLHGMNE